MITQNQIKSFKKCINPKAFNPLLSKLHYRKDKNVFVWTDSFILLEIPNTSDKYSFDFSIEYNDLKKITGEVLWIQVEDNKATIFQIWKNHKDIEVVIEKNENFPDYEHAIGRDKKTYEKFWVSPQTKVFFDICDILWIDTVETREKDIFYWSKDWMRIIYKIPLSYN